jgi:pimeloyl-ACP methyl ester carboxylesterase
MLDSISQRRYRNVVAKLIDASGGTMATAAHTATRLAYDDEGAGTPVVFVHGLTFDRRSWRPIIERLDGSVRSIAVDLPAHGESRGAPVPVEQIPARLHEVHQDVVVGYWELVLRSDPAELQAWIDTINAKLDVPCLGVFGRPITDAERERFESLPDVQLEEWAGDGHFVHLVDPDRFVSRLRRFIDHCTAASSTAKRATPPTLERR